MPSTASRRITAYLTEAAMPRSLTPEEHAVAKALSEETGGPGLPKVPLRSEVARFVKHVTSANYKRTSAKDSFLARLMSEFGLR